MNKLIMTINSMPRLFFVALMFIGLGIVYLDYPIALWFHQVNESIKYFFSTITILGESIYYLIPLFFLTIMSFVRMQVTKDLQKKQKLRYIFCILLFIFLSVALSGLLVNVIKIICGRARPYWLFKSGLIGWQPLNLSSKFHSFPSGHANTATAFALAISAVRKNLFIPFVVFSIVIAASRVIIGAHYLSDVMAGALIAVLTTAYIKKQFSKRCDFIFK